MYEFMTKQNTKLLLELEGRGVFFQYVAGQGKKEAVFQVTQSWASIHALLAKLRNYKSYAAWDNSLSVWIHDQELCLKFRTLDAKLERECNFSSEETEKIMDFLGRAPNLN